MRKVSILIFAMLAALFIGAGCGGSQATTTASNNPDIGNKIDTSGGYYREITAPQLYSLLQEENVFLLQYDSPSAARIPDTDLTILSIGDHLDQLPQDKSAPIAIYCNAGIRSAQGARELVELGYSRVYELAGGTLAWNNQGYPLITG